jgi:hypothetical protein
MPNYEIKLPGGEKVYVEADRLVQSPGGDLLILRPGSYAKPDVIPKGDWCGYGVPFVAARRSKASGKSFLVRADKRSNKREAKQPKQKRNRLSTDLVKFIRSYVVMSEAQTLVTALWAIHTHCYLAFQQTPYLAVTSPEKQCGKSRLLEVLELLVARPWMAVMPSEAVLYRQVHLTKPTLLLDEVDTIFNPQTAKQYEGHRAILNSGHRSGSLVPRCVGPSQQIQEFRVYCPKVLAGIGSLPDTVADRSVPIRLERKKRDEQVERFFQREARPVADGLTDRIEAWAEKNHNTLGEARPAMPDELSDRMQEGCEPLVAIADALGCGARARDALVEVLTSERLDTHSSYRLRLLADIKVIFAERDAKAGKRIRGISSKDLIARLASIEDAPWANYYGRVIEARDISKLLSQYGIKPVAIRAKDGVHKGYKRDPLESAWQRYLT